MKEQIWLLFLISVLIAFPSQAQDEQGNQVRRLPQIQMEDYTIIGLEKVVLPHKERQTIARRMELNWSENHLARLKSSPPVSFKSETKPGLDFGLPQTNVSVLAEYGSFNTMGVQLNAKLGAGEIIPFMGADYQSSDGHVDKANYTRGMVSGGIEGQAWRNSVFQLNARYRHDEQSLWSTLIPPDSTREATRDVWHFQAHLDQKLGEHFSVFSGGQFQRLDFENRFDYDQSLLSATAGGNFSSGQTSLTLRGRIDRHSSEGTGSSIQWESEHVLYSSELILTQGMANFSATAGIKAQHLEVEQNGGDSKSYLYPDAGIAFNGDNVFHVYARYQPGFEFRSIDQMLQAHPVADVGGFLPHKLKHRGTAGVTLKASPDVEFRLSSTYEQYENYAVLYAGFSDSSTAGNTLNYPYSYWEFRYVEDAKLLENALRIMVQFPRKVLIDGWLTYRWSELNAVDERDQPVEGNRIPYLPELSSRLKLTWYFFGNHWLQIFGEYGGERFNDVANSTKLSDYVLLDALANFAIARQVNLRFFGRNLLDQDYELYHTYSAPGISGGIGLEIKF